MITPLQLIEETKAAYADPKNRGVHPIARGRCMYLTADGKRCAVGRCFREDVKHINGEEITKTSAAIQGIQSWRLLLKPEYQDIPLELWKELQAWHDRTSNFTEDSISKIGLLHIERIKKAWTPSE